MNTTNANISITLWGAGTVRTLRPIWVAEELGLKYQLNPIGPRTGETSTPEYTALNPKQKVPFCEDGEFKLSESVAICRYLVNSYGDESTLQAPASIEQQAKQDEWLSFIYGELDETSLYVMRRHGALAENYGEAPAAMDAARDYVIRQLAVVEKRLQDNDYLLDEGFCLADLFLTTCLNWVLGYEIPMPACLHTYRERILERPAYQRAAEINQNKNQ